MVRLQERFDSVVDVAAAEAFMCAGTLFDFAADVLFNDLGEQSRWVVLRAIDRAEQSLRDAVDEGCDINTVEARFAAIRLRLGHSAIHDLLTAADMADDAAFDYEAGASVTKAIQLLRAAAAGCWSLACRKDV